MAEDEVQETPAAEGDAGESSADEGEAKQAPKSGVLVVVTVGFLVMIATPLTSFLLVKMAMPPEIETKSVVTDEEGETVIEVKALLVNIAETKGTRVLRVEPHLVLSEARLADNLKDRMPMLIDRISTAAARKTIDELEGPQGREALKRDIISEINMALKEKMSGAVVDVYFSEFLIQ